MNACIKTCQSCILILLVGITGAFFSTTPLAVSLEEEFGLSWLFKLRGALPPPEHVVIVSIDKLSADILRLPDDPEKWPRSYYARLIEKLNQQQPAIIAINIVFSDSRRPENDQLLAQAMSKGGNIILSNYLKRNLVPSTSPLNSYSYQRIIDPIPILDQAALDTAPFPLPKTSSTVKQFWTFKNSAGGVNTFPGSIFHCFVFQQVYPEIVQLLYQLNPPLNLPEAETFKELSGDVINTVHYIQSTLTQNPDYIQQLRLHLQHSGFSPEKTRLLNAWLDLLDSSNSLYFNHYGRAGTITTIPFYQALLSDILNPGVFNNKVVLVGYSEKIEPEKNRGLYTVYSSDNDEITSPIEIAATAVANLIDHTWLQPIPFQDQFLLLLGWGILLSAICRLFPFKLAISLIIIISIAYLSIAYFWFTYHHVWLPLFIPIMLQMPIVMIIASVACFRKRRREHQNMHQAFCLYLPGDVVNTVANQGNINSIPNYGELMQGVCMATDAGQYTTLSETLNPLRLNELMNNYYSVLFSQVKAQQGIISDVIGDAMLALWARPEITTHCRIKACHAALKIKETVTHFNDANPYQLPTRLGLHFGEIRLGNVGAEDHFEYRAVGDTVNTATRIEGLNKILGTQILVSAEVIQNLPDFIIREIGFFILKGKTQSIHIYELMSEKADCCPEQSMLIDMFSRALLQFKQLEWSKALQTWHEIERIYPNDGPTRFYIQYIKRNLQILSERTDFDQSSVINIGNNTSFLHS